MYYVVVDIGCLECGLGSNVIGIFTSKQEAENICKINSDRHDHSSRDYQVFEVDCINSINKNYLSK